MNDFLSYVQHFVSLPEAGIYLALALAVVFIMFILLLVYANIASLGQKGKIRAEYRRQKFHSLTERLYEIIFSGTSILFFMASYYLIERFLNIEPYKAFWNDHSDFLLLLLIILSCVLNNILDGILIRLRHIPHEEKAAGRLIGMLYMILIFCYIKFIYENNNYDVFITYFLGLMVGRFVYFDASFKDFIASIVAAAKNIPLMILALCYTGAMCLYGFSSGFLIKHIGVVTDTFVTHLFMCVAIFILYHIRLADFLVGKPDKAASKHKTITVSKSTTSDYEDEEDEYYEDESDEDDIFEYADYDEF